MICNKKRTIWTFSLLLGLLLAVGTGTVIGHRETALWKARAGEAFGQALAREIERRNVDTVYFSSTVYGSYRVFEHSDTGSVLRRYTTAKDEMVVRIPAYKIRANADWEQPKSDVLTYALAVHPLSADTLYRGWHERLADRGLPGRTGLLLNRMDLETGRVDSSAAPPGVSGLDTLAYVTLGTVCEVEVTALGRVRWYQVLSAADWGLLLLCLAFGLLPACVWPHVRRFFRRHLVREVPVEVTVEVPVEIPVVVAESSHPANYRLKDGTVFYGEQSALVREGQRIRLTAQAATLLRALLERPGEEVSTAVLMDRLWPDGSGNETRLYKSVDRLNKVLKEISTCRVESHWGTYCLRQDDGKSDKV